MNIADIGAGALQVLKTVAPTLLSTLAGPFAPLAAPFISKVFGSTDPKVVETRLLNATPEQLLALKQADSAHTEQLESLGIAKDKLAFDDTADARKREEVVKDKTPAVLVYLTTMGFFASLLGAFMVTIPESSKGIVFSMIGSLGTVWITQMGYYFGTSIGSAHKTDILASVSATAAAKTK